MYLRIITFVIHFYCDICICPREFFTFGSHLLSSRFSVSTVMIRFQL